MNFKNVQKKKERVLFEKQSTFFIFEYISVNIFSSPLIFLRISFENDGTSLYKLQVTIEKKTMHFVF